MNNRRKFLLAGLSLATGAAAAFRFQKKAAQPKTVKMLTQDGKLVTINTDHLPTEKSRATARDVQSWINPPVG